MSRLVDDDRRGNVEVRVVASVLNLRLLSISVVAGLSPKYDSAIPQTLT